MGQVHFAQKSTGRPTEIRIGRAGAEDGVTERTGRRAGKAGNDREREREERKRQMAGGKWKKEGEATEEEKLLNIVVAATINDDDAAKMTNYFPEM